MICSLCVSLPLLLTPNIRALEGKSVRQRLGIFKGSFILFICVHQSWNRGGQTACKAIPSPRNLSSVPVPRSQGAFRIGSSQSPGKEQILALLPQLPQHATLSKQNLSQHVFPRWNTCSHTRKKNLSGCNSTTCCSKRYEISLI